MAEAGTEAEGRQGGASTSFRTPRTVVALLIFVAVISPTKLHAQETVIIFDPANTKIEFTLGATLHTVHGTFQLKRGDVRFNPTTGDASGEVVVDTTSGNSENSDRDKKMHREILESDKYPEIIFVPSHVSGAVPAEGTGTVEVAGVMKLHGQDHPVTLSANVTRSAPGELQGAVHFAIPYVKWGLRNPSTFILRVSDTVDVDIRSTARFKN